MVIIPNEWIFLGAAIVLVVAVAPLIVIILKENKMKKAGIAPIAPAENKVD